MALKLVVPTLDSAEKAQTLKETILTTEPDARVEIDLDRATVTIEGKASEETFKQLVEASGHQIEA